MAENFISGMGKNLWQCGEKAGKRKDDFPE